MTETTHDGPPDTQPALADAEGPDDDRPAAEHPTGSAQAADNAENEPPG